VIHLAAGLEEIEKEGAAYRTIVRNFAIRSPLLGF
jgi:hypothetical protein